MFDGLEESLLRISFVGYGSFTRESGRASRILQ